MSTFDLRSSAQCRMLWAFHHSSISSFLCNPKKVFRLVPAAILHSSVDFAGLGNCWNDRLAMTLPTSKRVLSCQLCVNISSFYGHQACLICPELCRGDDSFTKSLGRFVRLCNARVRSCLDRSQVCDGIGTRESISLRARNKQGDPSADWVARDIAVCPG